MNEEATKKIRILVAEDHPIVADGIIAILAKANDMVLVGQARNGAETIELLKRHQPDIVLLDLRMPVVDGIGVATWIKRSGSATRTVILSVFHGESDVSQAIRAGANAYLLKDTPPTEILETIRSVASEEGRISRERRWELVSDSSSAELTSLELEILALIVEGQDNQTIGSKLGLRTDAVKYRLRGLYSKLGVRKRAAAARQAIALRLLANR